MRSQSFLRKSHSLLKQSVAASHPFPQAASCTPLRRHALQFSNGRPRIRNLSTAVPPPTEVDAATPLPPSLQPIEVTHVEEEITDKSEESGGAEEPDKAPTRSRRTRGSPPPSPPPIETPEFPPGLENDILYLPKDSLLESNPGGLPPPEIFEEALNKLLITLHPQNQLRSVTVNKGSRAVEPTLGLYCPIEGGDYIVDLTVHELAYQTGADVLILDAVQLAAGQWGPLGKAAGVLNLPDNPLHFSSPVAPASRPSSNATEALDEVVEEVSTPVYFTPSARLPRPIPLPAPLSPFSGRTMTGSVTTKAASAKTAKVDVFFDALVNLSLPAPESGEGKSDSASGTRPRLIYVRDFPTLAPSYSAWYPSLLAAAKQRRRTGSPVTIILGMTPPVRPPAADAPSASGQPNLMNMIMNQSTTQQPGPSAKHEVISDWDEGEAADIAREKRLKSRLRKWEKSSLDLADEFSPASNQGPQLRIPGASVIFIRGAEVPAPMGMGIGGMEFGGVAQEDPMFFRSSVIIPRTRSVQEERETRVARRREINELTMRMGIGAVGGVIESTPAQVAFAKPSPSAQLSAATANAAANGNVASSQAATAAVPMKPLWEEWGNMVEVWSNVRKIADATIGRIMAAQGLHGTGAGVGVGVGANMGGVGVRDPTEPTVVSWAAVQAAWTSYHAMIDVRKSWLKTAMGHGAAVEDAKEGGKDAGLDKPGSVLDPVVEALKNDPELDTHEERLLSCIVNSDAIKTTFKQVHLPTQTIDAVRTIVSLPLLHPQAFQQGILKDHGMTGCLLFGPPGTGKTLVVRALAKEAGCRMLTVSPSDVMDMYVGEGEKLVRAVFALARKLSPCVVFLDEIDALFGARVSARESGSAFAHRGIITEFMQQMDGLKSSKEDNIIIIGATNRPFDLDDAVLRRLPRRLLVDLPGEKERAAILRILLRDETLSEDVNVDDLSRKTDGFSGSDLKHLCVSAALDSIKQNAVLPWKSRHTQETTPSTEVDVPPAVEKPVEASEPASTTPEASTETSSATPEATPEAASESTSKSSSEGTTEPEVPPPELKPRILQLHNFTQALKEITPSSSEALGSLADLRKWNDEFGEGRRDRKKHQVWGKGRFGFINKPEAKVEEGKVAVAAEAKP